MIEPDPQLSLRHGAIVCLPPVALMTAAMTLAYLAGGASIGFFFAGFVLLTILLPPLLLTRHSAIDRLLIAGSSVDAAGVVWLVVLIMGWIDGVGASARTSVVQWFGAYLLLACYAIAIAGIVLILRRMRMNDVLAAASTVVAGLAWLTWPVWLSNALVGEAGGSLVRWLIATHPLMATNGLLSHLGVWSEQPLTYHLTHLGQHIPYTLPRTPLVSIALHMVLGAALLIVAAGTPAVGATDRPPHPESRRS
jgi:hypothetical protein